MTVHQDLKALYLRVSLSAIFVSNRHLEIAGPVLK